MRVLFILILKMVNYYKKILYLSPLFFILFFTGCNFQTIDETKYDILYQYKKMNPNEYDTIRPFNLYIYDNDLYFVGTKNFLKKKNILGFYQETPPVKSYLVKDGKSIFEYDLIENIFITNTSLVFIGENKNKIFIFFNGTEYYLDDFSLNNLKQINVKNNTLSIYSNESKLLFFEKIDNNFLYNCSQYNFSEFEFVSDCVLYKNKPTFIAQLDGIIYILSIKDSYIK
ncbi:MAG: hypothetical protein ACQERZ_09750 [Fusobacteriota bacterium]